MAFQQTMYPGTIMQKIEELREWQRKQQEKLLQQQEEQRILLNTEQERIYHEFGLSNKGFSSEQTVAPTYVNTPQMRSWLDSSSERSSDFEDSYSPSDTRENSSQICSEREELLTPKLHPQCSSEHAHKEQISPFVSMRQRNLNLDDTPVNSARKNFHELLEEKLEQFEDKNKKENQMPAVINNEKPKRKFLKKGEGIARFKMKPVKLQHQQENKPTTKKGSTSTGNTNVGHVKKKSLKSKQTKEKNDCKSKKSAGPSNVPYPKAAVSKLTLKKCDSAPVVGTWAHVLQQQSGSAKVTDIHKQYINSPGKDSIELSFMEKINDAERKNKKEVEELKIFELLEQHAENSSFCSTSSLVARLMEGSINSTPVKTHKYCATSHQNDNQISPKHREIADKLVSKTSNLPDKSTIVGYLPFGLDSEELDAGAYENNPPVSKVTIQSSGSEKSERTDEGNVFSNEKALHVRFAETNEYKSVSDASFSSQDECGRNRRHFRDDQAWSDCSCSSDSESPNTSVNDNQTPKSMEPRPVSQQFDVFSTVTNPGKFPVALDTESYSIFNNYANNSGDNQFSNEDPKTDTGAITQNSCPNDILQNSSLLRVRLEELEKEIGIFRKENSNLQKLKNEHENVVAKFRKEQKELEKHMKEEREKMENALREERKKLQKEKQVFEKYCKDLKNQPTKQEREEIQSLKQQLANLQEELHKKDSRWSAANIRTRDRIKHLEQENDQLKKEVDKLKKEKSQTKLVKSKSRSHSSTKVIHTINEHIAKIKPGDLENSIVVHDVVPKKKIPSSVLQQQSVSSHGSTKSKHPNSNKSNEWGTTGSKTFQAIPDLEPQPSSEDILRVLEENSKSNYKTDTTSQSSSSQHRKEIISLHSPADNASYNTSDDDMEAEVMFERRNMKSDFQIDRISAGLYGTYYCNSNQPSSTTVSQIYSMNEDFSKSRSSFNCPSIENLESRLSVTQNCSEAPVYDTGQALQSSGSIPGSSTNSEITNFIKGITSGASRDIKTSNENNPSSLGTDSQNSDNIVYTTANSTPVQISEVDVNVPSPLTLPQNTNLINYTRTDSPDLQRDNGRNDEVHNCDGGSRHLSYDLDFSKYSYGSHDTSPSGENRTNKKEPSSGQNESKLISNSSIISRMSNREKVYPDGRREIWYPNGNLKKISANGSVTKMIYYNGDVKESLQDGTVKYFYAETKTWHTTYSDGSEILEFPDGQMETRQKDGTKEVTYPNATVRTCYPDGREEWVFQDGLLVKVDTKLGEKVLLLPNGQREVHTREHMRREYPDGTVKIIYPDGIQETRYSNGRVRVKNREGNLVMDSILPKA